MAHVKTDPACLHYRKPRTWLQRWWADRNRGKSCPQCMLARWWAP